MLEPAFVANLGNPLQRASSGVAGNAIPRPLRYQAASPSSAPQESTRPRRTLQRAAAALAAAGITTSCRRLRQIAHLRCTTLRRRAIAETEKLTAASVIPEELLAGKYGRELEEAIDAVVEAMHISGLTTLLMEDVKDKSSVSLSGGELERTYFRTTLEGSEVTIAHSAISAAIGKRLMDKFPEDKVASEEDAELLHRDSVWASTVAEFLSDYNIVKGATPEDAAKWAEHAASIGGQRSEEAWDLPQRYWTLVPIDTTQEFRTSKQYCITLALIEDGEPVVSVIGAPVLPFDHVSRTVPHPSGHPVFFATKGGGAWTQLVVMPREQGLYQGTYKLKAKSLPLNVLEKIHRKNDGLYDLLGTEQLTIGMGSRLREDIFVDAERVGKFLGSDYPKFDFTNSSIKYCWVARGEADIAWYFPKGLYDDKATEHLVHHAPGTLIASESGADVADCNGEPIQWTGKVLEKNRGLIACDPKKAPIQGVVNAIKKATEKSVEAYDERCEKRKEVAKMLSFIFNKAGELAETDEERESAAKVKEKGNKMLQDEEKMNSLAQDSINRDKPILGDRPVEGNPFDGDVQMSPISTS